MSGHTEAEIKKHVRTYIAVFAALAALTVITVAISYLHLSFGPALALALAVASVKAGLVALFFMHLITEKKAILWLLGFTVFFFIVLLTIPPLFHH
ncbi:MAG: hypothetical protein MOGMAGMI_01329 [Candidatus Omnitrophica bacterium]|nr:hypothetical protein [Candidatus Omnitrophota bacterium]